MHALPLLIQMTVALGAAFCGGLIARWHAHRLGPHPLPANEPGRGLAGGLAPLSVGPLVRRLRPVQLSDRGDNSTSPCEAVFGVDFGFLPEKN